MHFLEGRARSILIRYLPGRRVLHEGVRKLDIDLFPFLRDLDDVDVAPSHGRCPVDQNSSMGDLSVFWSVLHLWDAFGTL